jgi:hypothetical protein
MCMYVYKYSNIFIQIGRCTHIRSLSLSIRTYIYLGVFLHLATLISVYTRILKNIEFYIDKCISRFPSHTPKKAGGIDWIDFLEFLNLFIKVM